LPESERAGDASVLSDAATLHDEELEITRPYAEIAALVREAERLSAELDTREEPALGHAADDEFVAAGYRELCAGRATGHVGHHRHEGLLEARRQLEPVLDLALGVQAPAYQPPSGLRSGAT
jgi:hypothetical protein